MKYIFTLALSLFASATQAAGPDCQKISPFVQKQLGLNCNNVSFLPSQTSDNSQLTIFVALREQADLSMQSLYSEASARREFVVSSLKSVALRSQAPLRQFLQDQGAAFTPYYIYNMIRVEQASPALVDTLAAREDVSHIFGNPNFHILQMGRMRELKIGEDTPSITGVEPNIESTGATRVWNELGIRGQGITVAGQDTGVQYDHPALAKQYRGNTSSGLDHNYNWYDSIKSGTNQNVCGFNTQAPCDDDQHGTHTMGTMLGDDGAANKIGMAPAANWIACRNMNAGTGTPSSYIDCFQFFMAPFPLNGDPFKDGNPRLAPHIINNSWGCPAEEGCKGDEMAGILKNMHDAGIFVVASAGNDGPGCSTIHDQPAQISDYTFSVGAHDHRTGLIASFSSRGPSTFDQKIGPDITAPGVGIRSSIPGGVYQGGFWSGTSMSGPHVVGLAALIWSANPKLIGHVDETAQLIRDTATPTVATDSCGGIPGDAIPNNTFGYGRIDAFKAVSKATQL